MKDIPTRLCGPPSGMAPLLNAARAGRVEVTSTLLTAGAGVDKTGALGLGLTPVDAAASNGRVMVITSLIEANAHVDKVTTYGATSVFVAVERGHAQALTSLTKANANADNALAVQRALNNMVRVRRHTRRKDLGYPVAISNEPHVIGVIIKKVQSEPHYCASSENVDTLAERNMEIHLPLTMRRRPPA